VKKPKQFVLSAFLKNAIRRLSYKCRARSEAYAAVRIPRPSTWPNKRVKWIFPCATCGSLFEMKETQCDHIEPIIPITGWPHAPFSDLYSAGPEDKDMNVLIYRTFVAADKMQILCKPCHKIKSLAENALRREK
jgi:hypothetical protein